MLYMEIIAVCSQIQTKHINTLCGQNVGLLNVKLAVHTVSTSDIKWLILARDIFENLIFIKYVITFVQISNLKTFFVHSDILFKQWRFWTFLVEHPVQILGYWRRHWINYQQTDAYRDCLVSGLVTPDTDRCNSIPGVKYWQCKGQMSGEFYSRIDWLNLDEAL